MQRSALCRSRRELSNAYLLAKIGVDTAENEPLEVRGENSIQYSLHSLTGTTFDLVGSHPAQLKFDGFGKAPNGDITMTFLNDGMPIQVTKPDPNASVSQKAGSGPAKADPGNKNHVPCAVPGEVLSYSVKTLVERFDIEPFSDFHPNDQTL